MKTYIGIDNGVSGSIASINEFGMGSAFCPILTTFGQDYTKTKKNMSRIDFEWLLSYLRGAKDSNPTATLERPMVNPGRFVATTSAMRALEATLIALELNGMPYQFIDSKEWQKVMLPSGLEKGETKKASIDIGCRLFPQHAERIRKHGDADGLLIAEWARRTKR